MSVIEISLQHISNGQYWILVRMCFTVSSKMRTKATYKCTSLVRHPGSVVVLTTSCLVHWNAEVPPNYGFGQGCCTGRSSFWFSSGPILVWDASPWVLDVSTFTDEKFLLIWVWKTQICGSSSFNFLLSRKTQSCWQWHIQRHLFPIYIYDSDFFFNWWHSPLAWWHSQELEFPKNRSK